MAIEHRFRRTYYYKKVRVNGKVRSIYLGAGEAAEAEALRQMQHQFYRNLWKAIDNLRKRIRYANRIQLEACGFHRPNRGQWRKRRIPKAEVRVSTTTSHLTSAMNHAYLCNLLHLRNATFSNQPRT